MRTSLKVLVISVIIVITTVIHSIMFHIGVGTLWQAMPVIAAIAAIRAVVKYNPQKDDSKNQKSLELDK